MSGTNWINNVFELGLLGTGATLAARLLGPFPGAFWLTNIVREGLAAVYYIDSGARRWVEIPYSISTAGLPFPYGREVSPP